MGPKINAIIISIIVAATYSLPATAQTTKKKSKKKEPQYISMTNAEYMAYEAKKKRRKAARQKVVKKYDFSNESESQSTSVNNSSPASSSVSTKNRIAESNKVSERLSENEYDQVYKDDINDAYEVQPSTSRYVSPYSKSSSITSSNSYNNSSTDSDSFILSIEPLWLLVYGIGAKAEYAITPKISVGISGIYISEHEAKYNESDDKYANNEETFNWSYQEASIGTNIMLTGALNENGFYINPSVGFFRSEIKDYGFLYLQGKEEAPQFKLTGGYQFVYQDFRLGLGAGFRLYDASEIEIKDEYGEQIATVDSSPWAALALDLHIGYVF